MKCAHCKNGIHGSAHIDDDVVLHSDCRRPYEQAKIGRTHRCPKCRGVGGETTETPRYHTEGGFNGYFDPGVQVFDGVNKNFTSCDFCDGQGYLAAEPEPITEPARIVGWKRTDK